MKKTEIVVLRSAFLALSVATITSAPKRALAEETCAHFMQFATDNAKEFGPLSTWITLKDENGAHTLIINFYEKAGSPYRKWIFLVRRPESATDYCKKSEGTKVEFGPDIHENSTEKRYGLPGSGYPPCSSKDEIPGGLFLRMWANRELGPATTLGLFSPTSTESDFSVLIGKDGPWIIIEQDKTGSACYFARGNKSDVQDLEAPTGKWKAN